MRSWRDGCALMPTGSRRGSTEMAIRDETRRTHCDLSLAGLRAEATATGLIQLMRELRGSGSLAPDAVGRTRDRVVDDLTLSCPIGAKEDAFRDDLRRRLDHLLEDDASEG